MVNQYIAAYIMQVFIFGGVGYLLNAWPKGTSMRVKVWQVIVLCVPGIGILAGIIMIIRYILR